VVYSDPEVRELLSEYQGGMVATRFTIPLKGFDDEQFELWRVARAAEHRVRTASGSDRIGETT